MLTLVLPGKEFFNEETNEFFTMDDVVVDFEHSLLSLSKWESKYQKPFLTKGPKAAEEIIGYIEAMVITPNLAPDVLKRLEPSHVKQIQDYIDSSQTATTFGIMPEQRGPGEVITSELIYFWMITFNIYQECETWHLNRLFALIRICNIKNSKQKKMSAREVAMRNRELNERRKAELGTKG